MATFKPPNPDFQSPRRTSGGSGMNPPSARATTRSTPGGKNMEPTKAVASVRSTPGGKKMTPASAEVPANTFVDPIATRETSPFMPKKAG